MRRCGIVGLGNMGSIYLKCLLNMKLPYEICVYDRDNSKLDIIDNQCVIKFYNESEFLNYVDFMIIATNSEEHMHYVNKGVLMKKDILVEKPMCINWKDYCQMEELVNYQKCIFVDHIEEYRRAFRYFKLKASKLKYIYIYRATGGRCRNYYDNVVLDLMPHDLGVAMSVIGVSRFEIESLKCEYTEQNIPKKIDVALIFENNVKCRVVEVKEQRESERYCVAYVEEGIIICDFQNNTVVERCYGEKKITKYEQDNPLQNLLEKFNGCIESKTKDDVAYAHALDVAKGYIRINKLISKEGERDE